MRVTVVDSDLPYPPTSGKRLRSLHLLLPLAKRHELTWLCRGRADAAETRTGVSYLRDHGVRVVLYDYAPPRKSGASFYLRLAANLLSPLPYSVASQLAQPFRAAVAEHATADRTDLVHFEWHGLAEGFGQRTNLPWVVDAHNVESLIWQRYHENEKRPLKRWFIRGQWRKFARFERRIFHAATRVIACSEPDAVLVRTQFGASRVDVVDNGIDREAFEGVVGKRDPNTLLFLGSFDWRPNLDGIDVLLREIFPRLRQLRPTARLLLVGRKPPPALVERVKSCPGVELHADVPDVRPYLAESGLMVVPLRIGGGSRLKILEALASGLPVVSTRIGAEGLELRHEQELILAEEAEMPAALAECLRNPEPARTMAERGRRFVLERYDRTALAARLEQVWETAVREHGALERPPVACALAAGGRA